MQQSTAGVDTGVATGVATGVDTVVDIVVDTVVDTGVDTGAPTPAKTFEELCTYVETGQEMAKTAETRSKWYRISVRT